MSRAGAVLRLRDAETWWRLIVELGRQPARYARRGAVRESSYAVLYGNDVADALGEPGVEPTALSWTDVELVNAPGMRDRYRADLEAGLDLKPGRTASCGLCGKVVRLERGVLAGHLGRELAAQGHGALLCRASGLAPDASEELHRREVAGLDALRLRAHP